MTAIDGTEAAEDADADGGAGGDAAIEDAAAANDGDGAAVVDTGATVVLDCKSGASRPTAPP
jgi:hypothetical protein